MTIVTSHVEHPANGTPARGVAVAARILAYPVPWLADSTGKVLGTSTTWTGPDGRWRLDLKPHTAFENPDRVYAEIVEHSNDPAKAVTYYARIPPPDPTDPTKPVLLRDILTAPPNGQTGQPPWTPVDRLVRLRDVDADSIRQATPGDYLCLLPNGKWGATSGPMPLSVYWKPDPDNTLAIYAQAAGFGGSGARLEWGDGTNTIVTTTDEVEHTYELPGRYTLKAVDIAWPAFTGTATVTVKDHATRAHAFLDSDDDWAVLLWLDEPDDGTTYRVDWGDNSPIEEIGGQHRVPPHPRVRHLYTELGQWTITVTDTATQRTVRRDVETGEIGQTWTFPNSPVRPRLEALWLKPGATWQLVDLTTGAVSLQGRVLPHGRVRGENPRDVPPGAHPLELREVVDGQVRRRSRRVLVSPTIWDWRLDVLLTWRATAGRPGHQDVTVTARKARAACVVSWGDGTPDEDVAANTPIVHTYDLARLPATGWPLQITEIGLPDPRTWTRLIASPRHVGQPVLAARDRGAVDVDVEGVDGPSNSDWYRIAWGDGSPVDDVGAVGRWYPAHHKYANPGTYQITLDGPGVEEPITREVTVAIYPSPVVTVTEARKEDLIDDPTRRTARISVDNAASGGPCLVDLGDGSPVRECAEVESFTHRYPPPASPLPPGWEMYWVIVTSKVDRTAKAQAVAQMPFGAPRTLFFTLSADPSQPDGSMARLEITEQDHRKTVQVAWGDGETQEVTVNPITHDYLDYDKTYDLTISYTDATESYPDKFTVPPAPARGGPR